jgi:hypothetical protein
LGRVQPKKRKRKENKEPRFVEPMTAQSVGPPVGQTCLGLTHIGQPINLIIIIYNIKKFKNFPRVISKYF